MQTQNRTTQVKNTQIRRVNKDPENAKNNPPIEQPRQNIRFSINNNKFTALFILWSLIIALQSTSYSIGMLNMNSHMIAGWDVLSAVVPLIMGIGKTYDGDSGVADCGYPQDECCVVIPAVAHFWDLANFERYSDTTFQWINNKDLGNNFQVENYQGSTLTAGETQSAFALLSQLNPEYTSYIEALNQLPTCI